MNPTIHGLEGWFAQRPAWLQDAARRIIASGSLHDTDIHELVMLCKAEAGVVKTTLKPKGIPKGSLQTSAKQEVVRLNSISEIKGINALSPRKPLEFGDAPLTIVYGPNGSGKSGYVRVLKHACGAKNLGSLHSDVFSGPIQQSCKFDLTVNGQRVQVVWSPSVGVLPTMEAIEIYDSQCAHVYVSDENEVTYEPWVLSLFTRLTDACAGVDQALLAEANTKVSKKPTLPPEFNDTEGAFWYERLTHATAPADVARNCEWNQQLTDERNALKQRLAEANPAEKAKALRKQASNATTLHTYVQGLGASFSDERCAAYFAALHDAEIKRRAADMDAKKVFEEAPLGGVGSESWKLLWEQARKYSETVAYPGLAFPNIGAGARCVLCQQPLDEESKVRFQSFESFVKGELEKQASTAEKLVRDLQDRLVVIPEDDTLRLRMDATAVSDDPDRQKLFLYCSALKQRRACLLASKSAEGLSPMPGEDLISFLKDQALSLERHAADFEMDAKGINHGDLERRAKELDARVWLSQQRPGIEAEVTRLKEIELLGEARKLASTTGLSTMKAKLAEELITSAYIQRFRDDLKDLGAIYIKVDIVKTRARKGHVLHQVKLQNCTKSIPAPEVLSEGEFRIVSLATFLADVEGREGKTPFIFDDPISSLDQGFEEATVDRLVRLSKTRQVIVFTHRVSMVGLLQAAAKNLHVNTDTVALRKDQGWIGHPTDLSIMDKKPEQAINTLLHERLKKATAVYEQSGGKDYEELAKGICSDIRITIESLIERCLLGGIIQRFRRDVQTKNRINKLAKITSQDCKLFDDMMTQYSKYEHSQPMDTPAPLPGPDQLRLDLEKLKNWLEEFDKRPAP